MKHINQQFGQLLRPPEKVMKLERLGSFHSSRLSFTRTLVRRMHREKWRFEIFRNTLDESGYGTLIYLIHTPSGPVSFISFVAELDAADRTDRVIAEKWDMCFTLFNGIPSDADIERLSRELPYQEAGRLSDSELVMSRANKSVRLFNSVIDCLASGFQPDAEEIMKIGYLIRTTAVYGNGKFGVMDFHEVKQSTPFGLPFQAEMLTVYMARQLSIDLVEHIAKQRDQVRAVGLSRELKRAIGVGNATGLGMAPFLIGHPQLIGQWIKIREAAIVVAKSRSKVTRQKLNHLKKLIERVEGHLEQWQTEDPRQAERILVLKEEITRLKIELSQINDNQSAWQQLSEWALENTSMECQELLNSLILEIYPNEINEFENMMGVDEFIHFDPSMRLQELKNRIEMRYAWALDVDFENPDSQHYFWYVSQEKEEPRLGQRYLEPGCELEMKVGIARDVSALYEAIRELESNEDCSSVADLLRLHPEFRHIVSRIQSLTDFEYGEIQNNLLGRECLPIDLLRCKLAIFGATRFDPKSNLWTRITLFQGAPLQDEIDHDSSDDWAFPVVPVITSAAPHPDARD